MSRASRAPPWQRDTHTVPEIQRQASERGTRADRAGQCLRARLRGCNVRTWSSLVVRQRRAHGGMAGVACNRHGRALLELSTTRRYTWHHGSSSARESVRHRGPLPCTLANRVAQSCGPLSHQRAHRSGSRGKGAMEGRRRGISVAALAWFGLTLPAVSSKRSAAQRANAQP